MQGGKPAPNAFPFGADNAQDQVPVQTMQRDPTLPNPAEGSRLRGARALAASENLIEQSFLKQLSELQVTFSYDGWRRDAELAEDRHMEYPNLVPGILDTMCRKQQVHSGDRSHSFIRGLDALTPTLSYDGWKDDARTIEWPENDNGYYAFQVEKMFELKRTKQAEHDGVRDHKNLRDLDKLVARLVKHMKGPSA